MRPLKQLSKVFVRWCSEEYFLVKVQQVIIKAFVVEFILVKFCTTYSSEHSCVWSMKIINWNNIEVAA